MRLPEAFPDKVTPGIDFTDGAVVQCDVPVVKIFLYVLAIYKLSQINVDVNTYGGLCTFSGPSCTYSFNFLRS